MVAKKKKEKAKKAVKAAPVKKVVEAEAVEDKAEEVKAAPVAKLAGADHGRHPEMQNRAHPWRRSRLA